MASIENRRERSKSCRRRGRVGRGAAGREREVIKGDGSLTLWHIGSRSLTTSAFRPWTSHFWRSVRIPRSERHRAMQQNLRSQINWAARWFGLNVWLCQAYVKTRKYTFLYFMAILCPDPVLTFQTPPWEGERKKSHNIS